MKLLQSKIETPLKFVTKEISDTVDSYLEKYVEIDMKLMVTEILEAKRIDKGLGGIVFQPKKVEPYVKDYDAEEDIQSILRWDVSNWSMIVITDSDKLIAGAIIAYQTDGVNMLRGRDDLAVLWDIRVSPEYRGQGLGSSLFEILLEWVKLQNCNQIHVETQNINVPACKFYISLGFELFSIDEQAYSDLDEIQLIWRYSVV